MFRLCDLDDFGFCHVDYYAGSENLMVIIEDKCALADFIYCYQWISIVSDHVIV